MAKNKVKTKKISKSKSRSGNKSADANKVDATDVTIEQLETYGCNPNIFEDSDYCENDDCADEFYVHYDDDDEWYYDSDVNREIADDSSEDKDDNSDSGSDSGSEEE